MTATDTRILLGLVLVIVVANALSFFGTLYLSYRRQQAARRLLDRTIP